jgi:hypothetical protein
MAIPGHIEGIDELEAFLKDHPKELNKSVVQSLLKGSNHLKKEIVAQMPAAIKKLKPIVASKVLTKTTNPTVICGIFGRKLFYVNRRGAKFDAFYLAYWSNYGTIARRDKGHVFSRGRRKVSAKWSGGIRPTLFFEKATDNAFEKAKTLAEDDLGKVIDSLSKKFGFK